MDDLLYAILNSDLNRVTALLNDGHDINILVDNEHPLLSYAVALRNMDMIKLLVEHPNTNVNLCGNYTPLHEAICVNNYDIVKYLMIMGANPYVQGIRGDDAFAFAEVHASDCIKNYVQGYLMPTKGVY